MVTTRKSIFTILSTIGNQKNQPRPFCALQFAEPENHAALVFAQNADGLRQNENRQHDDDDHDDGQSALIQIVEPG